MISIKSNKVRWALSGVLSILILFGTYRNVFSLAAFFICGFMMIFCDKETIILQIFYILPLANIFKLSPGVQSFFTILILAYVVLHLVLPRKATALIILFGIYVVLIELLAGQFNFFKTIKLICNVLFLSSILNGKVTINHKEVFLSYIVGNIVSSFFGLLNSGFFKIQSYIGEKGFGDPTKDNYVARFAGLYADPNYYAIGLIISLCLLVILLHRKEINLFFAVIITVPTIYFLIQTYSKSAVVMLFLPVGLLLYSLFTQKRYFSVLLLLMAAITVVILALSGQIPALELVMERFGLREATPSSDVDLNELTTGRFDLWLMYAEYLITNLKVGLFGEGIGAGYLNGFAAHNTYFDIFYYLGSAGGILLIWILGVISAQSRKTVMKRNVLNYSIMMCIIIMYFFLSELFYFDPPFQIFIAFMVLNLPMQNIINKNVNILAEE